MLGYTASFDSAAQAQEAATSLTSVGVREGNVLVLDSLEALEQSWSKGIRDGYLKSAGEPTYRSTIEGGGAVIAFLVNVGMAWKPFQAIEDAGGTVHGNFTAYRQEFQTGWLGPLAWNIAPFAKIEDRRWTNIFTEGVYNPTEKLWTGMLSMGFAFTPAEKLWTAMFSKAFAFDMWNLDRKWTGMHLGGRDKDV